MTTTRVTSQTVCLHGVSLDEPCWDCDHEDEATCPSCGDDFEGCECSAEEGGIGHDAYRDEEGGY